MSLSRYIPVIDLNSFSFSGKSSVPSTPVSDENILSTKNDEEDETQDIEEKDQQRFAESHHKKWLQNWTEWAIQNNKPLVRLKPLNDGTKVNIAVEFDQLHPEKQRDNYTAAHVALDALKLSPLTFSWCREIAGEYIHISWLRRNKMKFDETNDDFVVPFSKLREGIRESNMDAVKFMKEITSASNLIVKAVAEEFHQVWRESFQKTNPGEKRVKPNSDGTTGDINVPFGRLHPDWQRENYLAAHAAREICRLFPDDKDKHIAAEYLHEQWMFRNPRTEDNKKWYVPYADLIESDKEKSLAQVEAMNSKLSLDDVLVLKAAEKLHENWRFQFDPHKTGEKRMKINDDGSVQDINVPFKNLHFTWQKENLEAALDAKKACLKYPKSNDIVEENDDAASMVHEAWMKRNPPNDWNRAQHVPFKDLPEKEKKKDREQIRIMREILAEEKDGTSKINGENGSAKNWKGIGRKGLSTEALLLMRELIIAVCGDDSFWLESEKEQLNAVEFDDLLKDKKFQALPNIYWIRRFNFSDPFNNVSMLMILIRTFGK
jgi:hypothetical protein